MFSNHCNFRVTAARGMEPEEAGALGNEFGAVVISAVAVTTDEEHGAKPFHPHGVLSITLPCDPRVASVFPGQEFKLILADVDAFNRVVDEGIALEAVPHVTRVMRDTEACAALREASLELPRPSWLNYDPSGTTVEGVTAVLNASSGQPSTEGK